MLLASAGLSYQLYEITYLYFEFLTVTELIVTIPTNMSAPALSLCFPYQELSDKQKLDDKIPEIRNKSVVKMADLAGKLTIKDMFDMTPKPSGMFDYCMYREPKSYRRHLELNGEKCDERFVISKYYKQQYICYQFNMTSKGTDYFTFDHIQDSLVLPGMFYELDFLKAIFERVDNIQAIVHAQDVKPRGNKAFPVVVSRVAAIVPLGGVNQTLKDDSFFLSYSMFINKLLPAPYSSDCIDYQLVNHESQEECIDQCVTREIVALRNKVPFFAVSVDPVDLMAVSAHDYQDAVFVGQVTAARAKCSASCSQPNCEDEIYVTKLIRSESSPSLTFRLYVANEPTMLSTSKKKLTTSEFLVFALSCFGIWFGVNFFSVVSVIEAIEMGFKDG
ncbi:hypothetical protein HDE_13210 [Halotydeus destructor]|nr:hypothetical protein HDE_13210 [Halotydeus destructor]